MLEKFLSKKRAEMINKLIPLSHRKGRILDIGCGNFSFFLINTNFREKYGIDKMITDDKKEKNMFIKKYDIEKEGLKFFENNYFDTVTMLAVFEHLDPILLLGAIKEVKRVLKPEGVFILTTPAPWSNAILQILAKLKMINPDMIKEHKILYSIEDISAILSEAGFLKEYITFGNFELFMNNWSMAVNK